MQELVFEADGTLSFKLDEQPVLGMGEGGPRPQPGRPWREQPVQFDRRGQLDTMEPRWQADMYGSRNPVAMLLGTGGWGLFVADAVGAGRSADSRPRRVPAVEAHRRRPRAAERTQSAAGRSAKGCRRLDAVVPGLYDIFVFDAHDPARRDEGLLGHHRTGRDAAEVGARLHAVASHARRRRADARRSSTRSARSSIPLDAVIYLGTGFAPRGWNTRQPSFDFNPDVFKRDPKAVLADMHARNVKVVVHMVPWDRDRLPTLHGTIPARPGEDVDASHIQNYWQQHVPLVKAGIDAFWPDEGDWFNLFERIKRHQLYYQGHLSTQPERSPVESAAQRLSRASRSGAAGSGRATPKPRGRRSRRRSPSASTTR